MKTMLLIALVVLLLGTGSCRVSNWKDGSAFSKNATASLSRVKLFTVEEMDKDSVIHKYVDPTVFWAQFDATKRSSIVAVLPDPKNRKLANIKVLAENTPDAAIESISKLTAKMSHKDFSAEVAGEFARSIAQIKRSSAVENFRTISYRMAEIVSSNGDPDTTVVNLFRQLIRSSVETAQADSKVAEKELEVAFKEAEAKLKGEESKAKVLEGLRKDLEKEEDQDKKKEIRAQIVRVQLGTEE